MPTGFSDLKPLKYEKCFTKIPITSIFPRPTSHRKVITICVSPLTFQRKYFVSTFYSIQSSHLISSHLTSRENFISNWERRTKNEAHGTRVNRKKRPNCFRRNYPADDAKVFHHCRILAVVCIEQNEKEKNRGKNHWPLLQNFYPDVHWRPRIPIDWTKQWK